MTLITGLDIETTGLDMTKGDRIIEVCLRMYRLETRQLILNYTKRINPQGRKIHAKALEVHKIASSDLIGAQPFNEVATSIEKILSKSDAVVTHNGNWFDLPFLAIELGNCDIEMPADLISFDTMVDGMWSSYDSKPPSLAELCWSLGVVYDPAKSHAAEYDVDVMMQSFFKALDRDLFKLEIPETKKRMAS